MASRFLLGAEERIWTSAALFTRPTPLAGEPLRPLGYFRRSMEKFSWRREWDSNPRMLSHRRFSRPVLSTTQPSLRMQKRPCCQMRVIYYHAAQALSTKRTATFLRKIWNWGLKKKKNCGIINRLFETAKISGCGEVWYRAWMGFKRPLVRIQSLGPWLPNTIDEMAKKPVASRCSAIFYSQNSLVTP